MALHAPSHHLPAPHLSAHSRQVLRDIAIAVALAVVVVLVFGAAFMMRPSLPQFLLAQPEGQALVEFRAGERAAWETGQTSEGQSILLFRASERAER